ncbi:MAG: tetratricopeptide repeat protein [Planctomycetes bacterium]|nr:tetratricopeptide repeat protein [Planctomycetota bacterium]
MTVADQDSNLPDILGLWDYNDPAGTESKLRAVLAKAVASDDRGYHAELLTQIARAQGLQRQFDEAHATLDRADAMIGSDMRRAKVRLLVERGRVFNSSGSADKAKPLFVEAWELASGEGIDGLAVDAAHMVATVEVREEGLKWNHKALDLANSSSDPDAQRWTGSLCNNIGWSHHSNGEYDKALIYFEQALQHRRAQGKADDIRIARWCIARCLRSLDRVEEALAVQRELEQQIAEIEDPDGYIYEELAECLQALGRTDEARAHFLRAHELLSKNAWFVEGEATRLARLAMLGGVD